jgi:hypothetical protein
MSGAKIENCQNLHALKIVDFFSHFAGFVAWIFVIYRVRGLTPIKRFFYLGSNFFNEEKIIQKNLINLSQLDRLLLFY